MTRKEAEAICLAFGRTVQLPAAWVRLWEQLGMLKLDQEPIVPTSLSTYNTNHLILELQQRGYKVSPK